MHSKKRKTNSGSSVSQTPNNAETHSDLEQKMEWPEDTKNGHVVHNIFELWTYSYMNRMFQKGRGQNEPDLFGRLTQGDLYRVPRSIDASFLSELFSRLHDGECREEGTNKFYRTVWKIVTPTFIPAGYCQLMTVIAQVSIPVVVREILSILEMGDSEMILKRGVPYSLLLFVCYIINAFGNQRHHFLSFKSGVTLRAAIVSVIYKHTLFLDPSGRAHLTTGEVTNLVAIDAQKLFEVMQEAHLIWSMPLSMTLVTLLLLWVMGPTTLIGILVLFLMVPIVKMIVSRMVAVRHQRVTITDERIEMISSMLQGIRVTKLNHYEERFARRIGSARRREMTLVRKQVSIWAWTLVLTVVSPVMASAATFVAYVLVSEDNILTASDTFAVLLLFSALRFPINYAGKLVGKAAEGFQASKRILNFLSRSVREKKASSTGNDVDASTADVRGGKAEAVLSIQDGYFEVGGSGTDASFTLSDIQLSVSPSQILAVVGQVGSGKSSLVNALLGELAPVSPSKTKVNCRGTIGYAPQIPFVLNASVRDNILFGNDFDQKRYDAVIEACCLEQDFIQFGPARDLTEIGERGVTLSGGQKQRVSLARVVYSEPSIALFDDPLSALDADTSRRIFENLFKRNKTNTLLKSSAIVLVTHAVHFLNQVDQIMVLDAGNVAFYGTRMELVSIRSGGDDTKYNSAVRELSESLRESFDTSGESSENENSPSGVPPLEGGADSIDGKSREISNPDFDKVTSHEGSLMTVEERLHGISNMQTWLVWFRHAGGWGYIFLLVLLLFIDRGAYVATEWWLAIWTMASDEPVDVFFGTFPAQTDGYSAQYQYLKVYAIILLVSFTGTSLRSQWIVSGGVRCADALFQQMLKHVIRAPMSYFETTPMGRILNRFTYDVEVLDETLTQSMTMTLLGTSWFIAGIAVMVSILPWVLCPILPVTWTYFRLQLYYRRSAVDLQRLDAVSRSPIQASLAEGIDGAVIIRAFAKDAYFIRTFNSFLNDNSSAMLNFISAHRWLALRIEILGSLISVVASLTVVILNGKLQIEPGFVGMLLMWTANFTITLGFLVDSVTESEAAITSIERIHAMSELPQEREVDTPKSDRVDSSWPAEGTLAFENVYLRYRVGLPLALKGLSFRIEARKRCGVVGRTGAGKSSLTVALFRLVEIESGRISLDGVDLSTLGLRDVRGRPNCMSIIPQDPVLFAGTLRDCVDPFGISSNEEVLDALVSVRLSNATSRGMDILKDHVEEGGENFSVGERQLLCLARAMLSKPKILIMDEATASVDGETDSFIQDMLLSRFRDTTLLTIAHRLNTIMDYDSILVMDDGKAVEFGSPYSLLEEKNSLFSELVNATGVESAATLKTIAKKEHKLGRDDS